AQAPVGGGTVSVRPLNSGITTTNPPANGKVLFTDGTIYYWDFVTNAPATNVVLTGQISKLASSTTAAIIPGGIGNSNMAALSINHTNFTDDAINWISNLTYQAAIANDMVISNNAW